MANNFETVTNYIINQLDLIYQAESKSQSLTTNSPLVTISKDGKEFKIPKYSMQGLANYDKTTGYNTGDVTVSFETKQANYERARRFVIDIIDNMDTAGIALAGLMSEFTRTQVIPEQDAFTFAKLAEKATTNTIEETFTDGNKVLEALNTAYAKMSDDQVPESDRILFITPTLLKLAQSLDLMQNKQILTNFSSVVEVPQARFYSQIDLKNDANGGYAKSSGGVELNFLIAHRPAVIKFDRHITSNMIDYTANQTHDGYIYKYRRVGIVDIYDNKEKGLYVSKKGA